MSLYFYNLKQMKMFGIVGVMKKASVKQLRAVMFLSQGYSKRQSLIKAGYSVSTANQGSRVLQTKIMRNLTESIVDKLNDAGVTTNYVVGKISEWIEAKKIVNGNYVNDYTTQIKAFDIYLSIIKEYEKDNIRKTKQSISIKEFIMND